MTIGVLILAKLYVVGTGPGDISKITAEALAALKKCEVIVGYTVYTDIIKKFLPNKKYVSTPMTKEKDRCLLAYKYAETENTPIICSGDAGVYGMAGLVIELKHLFKNVELTIIPGVTAALSGGALLGSPLTVDFAVISLSDLLTPYELIQKRIRCAAQGDFVICIYNPSSKKRSGYLKEACQIIMEHRGPETVCGVVRNIGRDGEEKKILTLKELCDYQADMFTTVFIGNSATTVKEGLMVTPRGYIL